MIKPWRRTLLAAAASTSLFLAACGGEGSDSIEKKEVGEIAASDINPTPREDLKDGGSLTTAIGEIPEQLNIFHANATADSSGIWHWHNPVMGLFDGEGNYSPNPDYLTNVTEDEVDGNTVITYDIVNEATFNDGTPIDWTAFNTTWIINSGRSNDYNPSSTDGYERILSVTQGDSAKQAIVTFDGPYPWWQGLFNSVAHPALKEPENYHDYINNPHPEWGAGPFKIENFDPQRGEVSFVRNEKWWGDTAKLERRVYRQMEPSAEVNAFRNGEVDAAGVGSKDRYAMVKKMPGVDIRIATRPANSLITFNSEVPALGDVKVRQALATAINRVQIGEILFNGIPYTETPPNSLILFHTQEGYEDNFKAAVPKFDPEAARSRLDEAGWAQEGDGIRTKDGQPLTLRYTLLGDDPVSNAMAVAIQAMMRDIGVDLQIDSRPVSEFSKVISTYDFDVLPIGFASGAPFGVAYFGQMYRSDSQLNRSGTGSEEFDAKITELQNLPTREEQIKRANELEKEAFKFFGIMPLANGASMVAVKEDLANVGAPGFGSTPPEDIGWIKK